MKRSINSIAAEAEKPVSTEAVAQKQKKRAPRKKVSEPCDVNLMLNFTIDHRFIARDLANPVKRVTHSKSYISRKWNQKKLKIPTNLELERPIFDKFLVVPGLHHIHRKETDVEPEIPAEGYNYGNAQDREYCSQQNVSICALVHFYTSF